MAAGAGRVDLEPKAQDVDTGWSSQPTRDASWELSSADVDTRTDIYSLGVLLYELLTGTTPFDAHELLKAGFDEIRRVIRNEEPVRPSTRLSTMVAADLANLSTHHGADAPKLIREMRGELDWIVMKALDKDRSRRYGTASDLARDIERYLRDEPVEASPPSAAYRMRVLVVEDEKKVAKALREGLEAEHYDVRVASSGEDGFFLVNHEVFDCVVLDLMLPQRDGLEVLTTLRKVRASSSWICRRSPRR